MWSAGRSSILDGGSMTPLEEPSCLLLGVEALLTVLLADALSLVLLLLSPSPSCAADVGLGFLAVEAPGRSRPEGTWVSNVVHVGGCNLL